MKIYSEIVGVILAGGKSTRMGSDKALIELNGQPLIGIIAQTLRRVFERVIIISNSPESFQFLGLEIFQDLYKNSGPMGGIHSAFFHTTSEQLFIMACDTPFVSAELIHYAVEYPSTANIQVTQTGKQIHPLLGLYHRKCMPILLGSLENRQFKMKEFLEKAGAAYIPIDESLPFYSKDLYRNLNSKDDVAG